MSGTAKLPLWFLGIYLLTQSKKDIPMVSEAIANAAPPRRPFLAAVQTNEKEHPRRNLTYSLLSALYIG